jgi:membrane protein
LSPLLVISVAAVDFLYGGQSTVYIRSQLETFLGPQTTDVVISAIQNVHQSDAGTTATIVGIVALVIGATGVFTELQDSMNTIWEVKPKPRRYFTEILRSRALSFAMVLGICFLLLVSLLLSAIISALSAYVSYLLPGTDFIWRIVDVLLGFTLTTLLFALIYKVLPDVHISWSDVWIGAASTAVLFTIGKVLIGLYLGRSTIASAYGAAGSILVVLAWVYYSSQILFLGAEFTQVYANRYGSRVRPARGAVSLREEDRIQRGIPHQETVDDACKSQNGDEAA